jgi:hypothetical protein
MAIRVRSQANPCLICGAQWDRDRFFLYVVFRFSSFSIILTLFPTILHFVPTDSVESSQLTALLKGTLFSFIRTHARARAHTHTRTHAHLYCVLSHIAVYNKNCVCISYFGLCWLHPCLIVVYFSTFRRPLMPL